MRRKNDKNTQHHFRSNRLFVEDSSWYFNTRNGEVIGPFRDELEAITQLEVYIRRADAGLLPPRGLFSRMAVGVKNAG